MVVGAKEMLDKAVSVCYNKDNKTRGLEGVLVQPNFFRKTISTVKASENDSRRSQKKSTLFYIVFLVLGIAMLVWGFFAPRLGILPFLGFFFILFWTIMTAREYHGKFIDLRAEYIAKWRNEEKIAVDMKTVAKYTALSLLPLYFLMAVPWALVVIIGHMMAWLMMGASSTIISIVVLHAFSATWKDLYIKLRYYWLMQAAVFAAISGVGSICFLLSVL